MNLSYERHITAFDSCENLGGRCNGNRTPRPSDANYRRKPAVRHHRYGARHRTRYPSEVRFDRKAPHIALGGGIHKCLGMHLARFELQTALEIFLAEIPQFRFKGGFEPSYSVGNITFVPRLELQWN